MAKWNFFVSNTSLIKELDTSGNDVNPQSQSFLAPTLDLQGSKIVFKDNGSYKTAIMFPEIGEIDGVNPSDLQDAYDRIIAIIPNSGGGGGGTLQQVTDNGNTTTNAINTGNIVATDVNSGEPTFTGKYSGADGRVLASFIDLDTNFQTDIVTEELTANRKYTLPNTSGTIALTSDIPTVDATPTDGSSNAVSSNGVFDGLALKQNALTETNFGAFSNSLTDKTTPVDADTINIVDSADSNKSKKVTLTNFKAFLKSYFDTQYQPRVSFKLTDTVASSNLTGTTTETVMKSYTIDANSFAIGDFFNVKLHINYTTANSGTTRIQYLKVSNTNNYATANTVLQNQNSVNNNYALLRNSLYFVSGNILRTVTSETSKTIDNGNFSAYPVDYTLDPTQPIYVWVGMKNSITTDVGKFLSLSITN